MLKSVQEVPGSNQEYARVSGSARECVGQGWYMG